MGRTFLANPGIIGIRGKTVVSMKGGIHQSKGGEGLDARPPDRTRVIREKAAQRAQLIVKGAFRGVARKRKKRGSPLGKICAPWGPPGRRKNMGKNRFGKSERKKRDKRRTDK